jgi:hypothetical protein
MTQSTGYTPNKLYIERIEGFVTCTIHTSNPQLEELLTRYGWYASRTEIPQRRQFRTPHEENARTVAIEEELEIVDNIRKSRI